MFTTKTELLWGDPSGDPEFNVYQATLTGGPPAWDCVASGLQVVLHQVPGTPLPGETWAFLVTKVDAGVEGPLGWGGSGCTERTNATACSP